MVISFTNQKGGTGKTTSALTTAQYLSKKGFLVLYIDLDPVASGTNSLMHFDDENENGLFQDETVYRWLIDCQELEIRKLEDSGISIVPSNHHTSQAELELALQSDSIENFRGHRLKKMLDQVKERYHYVIIDCPGNMGLLTLNGICASDAIITVTSVGKFERNATKNYIKTLNTILSEYNPDSRIAGILLTMTDPFPITEKTRKKMQMVPEINNLLFKTEIPKNNAIRNAIDEDMPIWTYDPFSPSAKAYIKFWDELKLRLNLGN